MKRTLKKSQFADAVAVAAALADLGQASAKTGSDVALIGGQALMVHKIPRFTSDVDALVEPYHLMHMAEYLVTVCDWSPLDWDEEIEDYVIVDVPTILFMDDPVLMDMHEQRMILPMVVPVGDNSLVVELLAAQHPVEKDMLDSAAYARHFGIRIRVAPLGGILLVKKKADRVKDIAAIEQAAEHLPKADLDMAVLWAHDRDPETAAEIESIFREVKMRKNPTRRRNVR